MSPHSVVGVDVSKHRLDIRVHPEGLSFQCSNDPDGVEGLLRTLEEPSVQSIAQRRSARVFRKIPRRPIFEESYFGDSLTEGAATPASTEQ